MRNLPYMDLFYNFMPCIEAPSPYFRFNLYLVRFCPKKRVQISTLKVLSFMSAHQFKQIRLVTLEIAGRLLRERLNINQSIQWVSIINMHSQEKL